MKGWRRIWRRSMFHLSCGIEDMKLPCLTIGINTLILLDGIPSEDYSLKDIDYAAPTTIADAVAILKEKGDRARCLAGGTDIIVQVREGKRPDVDTLVDIKHIPELNELSFDGKTGLRIGAAVPCYRIYEDQQICKAYPGLIDAVALVGEIQIQSRASLGGNLCNSSPAADTIPALVALETSCVIAGPEGTREVPVENFCTAPGK